MHDASLPPFEGKHKVFIIDGAELLSIEAANRLLKTLEEPEAKVIFILLTTDENKLLKTVVSRCQRIELQPMSIAEETQALIEKLKIKAEEPGCWRGFRTGARGGRLPRRATGKYWNSATGTEPDYRHYQRRTMKSVSLMSPGWRRGSVKTGRAVYDTLDRWRDYWRDLMLVKLGREDMMTNIDRKDELTKMAGNYSLARIRNFIKSIESAAVQLKQNVNARLALEVLMLDLPREEAKVSPINPGGIRYG